MSSMNMMWIVARKEMKDIMSNKRTLLMGICFALWFGILNALAVSRAEGSAQAVSLNNSVFYILLLGVFVGYILSGQIFLREKRERIIETLLCTPLSLRSIWFGKVVGATIPAYLVSLLTAALVILVSNIMSSALLFPSVAILIHILVAVPAFIAASIGLLGFCQFLLGMRENQIVGLLVFMALFGALYFTLNQITSLVVSWVEIGILLIVSLSLLTLTTYLSRYLSKEKVVTTIP